MIARIITQDIINNMSRGKIITLIGPRQVGKTTLLNQLTELKGNRILNLNCDDIDDVLLIQDKTTTELKNILSGYDLALIDEAQRVENVGLVLKKMADLKLPMQIIVTGSSSLGLRDKTNEPATGRLIEYNLFPFTIPELAEDTSWKEEERMLSTRLIYGLYPDVVMYPADAKRTLMSLTNSYLYKDLFAYEGIRKPEVLRKLVRALAFQVGSEVSYRELSQLVGIDRATVESYIDLLEKCFVVFRLDSFSRNLRNEIKKGKKIYFYDNGVRNAVISNFAPVELRNDIGVLWENLMVSERMKRNIYHNTFAQQYFWRTTDQQEIDLVEDLDGMLTSYEFKWNSNAKVRRPVKFLETYTNSGFNIITPTNYRDYLSAP